MGMETNILVQISAEFSDLMLYYLNVLLLLLNHIFRCFWVKFVTYIWEIPGKNYLNLKAVIISITIIKSHTKFTLEYTSLCY